MLGRQVDGLARGLVKVVGNMVGTGRGQGVHWRSEAVRVVLEAIEGRTNTLQDCHIVKKDELRYDVMVFGRFYFFNY